MRAGPLWPLVLPGFPGPRPTFDKEFRAAFLTPHHTLVGRIVGQGALADGQGALGPDGLEDVPGQGTAVYQEGRGCPCWAWCPSQTPCLLQGVKEETYLL